MSLPVTTYSENRKGIKIKIGIDGKVKKAKLKK